jgi:hypothetical protein
LIIGFIFITLCFFLVGSDQSVSGAPLTAVSGVGVLFFFGWNNYINYCTNQVDKR